MIITFRSRHISILTTIDFLSGFLLTLFVIIAILINFDDGPRKKLEVGRQKVQGGQKQRYNRHLPVVKGLFLRRFQLLRSR